MSNVSKRRVSNVVSDVIRNVLFCVVLLSAMAVLGYSESHYTMPAVVFDKESEDVVIVEDITHNLWAFEQSGLEKGDKVMVTYFTNFTDDREDDIMTKVVKK